MNKSYKVLVRHNKQLWSWSIGRGPNGKGNNVRYMKNKWTKRPKYSGPLALFSDIYSAIKFVICNTVNMKDCVKVVIYVCDYKESGDNILWTEYNELPKHMLPLGTVLANEVMITESKYVYRIEDSHAILIKGY